jgi:hypothetical protein
MIRPQLTADGRAVEIPTAAIVAAVLDALAVAYYDDTDVVSQLLAAHGDTVLRREFTAASVVASDLARVHTASEADASREQLLAELDADASTPVRLSRIEAFQLADHLMTLATRTARTTAQEITA